MRTPEQQRSRRVALARARRCTTCRDYRDGSLRTSTEPCLGCQEPLSYYSCAPGYCRACAHDPKWIPVADVWPEALR